MYPYINITPNAHKAEIPSEEARKFPIGKNEPDFFWLMITKFPENVFNNSAGIKLKGFNGDSYEPDILFADYGNKLFIDIEIDEPYDYIKKRPTHCIDEIENNDKRRDSFFLKQGWNVIRFAEEQIIKYPLHCLWLVEQYALFLQKTQSCPGKLKKGILLNEIQVSHWTKEEAEGYMLQQYRNEYSKDNKLGKVLTDIYGISSIFNMLQNIPAECPVTLKISSEKFDCYYNEWKEKNIPSISEIKRNWHGSTINNKLQNKKCMEDKEDNKTPKIIDKFNLPPIQETGKKEGANILGNISLDDMNVISRRKEKERSHENMDESLPTQNAEVLKREEEANRSQHLKVVGKYIVVPADANNYKIKKLLNRIFEFSYDNLEEAEKRARQLAKEYDCTFTILINVATITVGGNILINNTGAYYSSNKD